MKLIYRTLSVLALGLLAQTAWPADSLAQRIEACGQHQDDAARLKCFDAEARALRAEHAATSAPANAAAVPATAGAARASSIAGLERASADVAADASTSRAAASGLADRHPARAEPLSPSRPVAPRDNPASGQPVTARVISISKTPTLQRRIELDNGQVWQENEHDKSLLLAAGDSVQIQSGALRSFVLRVPSGAQTHVRRVR